MSKLVLAYWDIRGFAEPHRLLLKFLGVDFEDKRYTYTSGPEIMENWLADKFNLGLDFPNLPYLIDGDIKVTESKAILKHLAKTRGDGKLYPQATELQTVADVVDGVVTEVQQSLFDVAYSETGIPETPLEEAQAPKLKQLENFFSKRKWTVGENISYIDFYVYEVFKQFLKYKPEFLKPYPALSSYVQKFEALPQLADYIKANEKVICYSPGATLKF